MAWPAILPPHLIGLIVVALAVVGPGAWLLAGIWLARRRLWIKPGDAGLIHLPVTVAAARHARDAATIPGPRDREAALLIDAGAPQRLRLVPDANRCEDIVFLDGRGTVLAVHPDLAPARAAPVAAREALAALRLPAGQAAGLGLEAGVRVQHPVFARRR